MKNYLLLLPALLFSLTLSAQTAPAWQWAKTIGWNVSDNNGRGDTGNGVATDEAGNVYVTGEFLGAVDFGDGNLITSYGYSDMYLASYDCSGNFRWVVRGGTMLLDRGIDVAVGQYGDVYVAGAYMPSFNPDSVRFGDTTFIGRGDFFFAKYDTAGNFHWFRNTSLPSNVNSGGQRRADIDFDGMGNPYVVSENFSSAFPGYNFNGIGFLAKYDTAGNLNRVTEVTKPITGDGFVTSLAVDSIGNAYVGGYFTDSVIIGGVQMVTDFKGSAFIAKFDTAGTLSWVKKSYSSPSGTGGVKLANVNSTEVLFVSGAFQYFMNWGGPDSIVRNIYLRPFVYIFDTAGNELRGAAPEFASVNSGGAAGIDISGSLVALPSHIRGTVTWDGVSASNAIGYSDPTMYMLDTALNVHSINVMPTVGDEKGHLKSVAFDYLQNLYVAGSAGGTVYLSTDTAYFKGGHTDALLAKFGTDCSITSISEELLSSSENLQIKAWPNPTDRRITIAHDLRQSSGTLLLHDMQGRKLLEREIRPNVKQTELDLSGRAAGLYLISLVTERDRSSVKVMVR